MLEEKMDKSKDGSVCFNPDETQQFIQKAREKDGSKAVGTYLNVTV